MQATKEQKLAIRRNCEFNEDIKAEWVQWATGDNSKTSLLDLDFEQANKIIAKQTGKPYIAKKTANWGAFDKENPKHLKILSLLRQAQWTTEHPKFGTVADLNRLDNFLRSEKSPVKSALMNMNSEELEKIIKAFQGIVKSVYK